MTGVYTIQDFGPSDLLTSAAEGSRRVKTSDGTLELAAKDVLGSPFIRVVNVTRIGAAVAEGQYYSAYLQRGPISATSEYIYELYAPSDKDIFIDAISPTADFASAGTGSLNYRTEMYFEESNINNWTYTGGSAPSAIGRNMSGYHINTLSGATVSAGGTLSTLTGTPDFVVSFINYKLESQGSNQSLSGSEAQFFDHDRTIRVKAGTKCMFRTVTSGTITGTFSVQTYIDYLVVPIGGAL